MQTSTELSLWSRLPDELSERVLSQLRLPALCRCRAVCKKWKELLRKPSFLNLYDLNWKNKPYLLATRFSTVYVGNAVDVAYLNTTCFLDLDERRWYSIPTNPSLLVPAPAVHENVPGLSATDDGFMCELSAFPFIQKVPDIGCESRFELPALSSDGEPVVRIAVKRLRSFTCVLPVPEVVTVVDNAYRSFKVFIMGRVGPTDQPPRGLLVYESYTREWRCLPNPPERLGVITLGIVNFGGSATFFQGNLYAISEHYSSSTVLLLSYNLPANSWREVVGFVSTDPGYPQLIVVGDRMFMTMWFVGLDLPLSSKESSLSSVFEIKEILVDENSSTSVVRITHAELQQIFGYEYDDFEISLHTLQVLIVFGFPLSSDTVVLFSRRGGRLITYNVRSGSVEDLPPHPLIKGRLEEQAQAEWAEWVFRNEEEAYANSDFDYEEEAYAKYDFDYEVPPPIVNAKLMNLSLRSILSGGSVSHRGAHEDDLDVGAGGDGQGVHDMSNQESINREIVQLLANDVNRQRQ